MEPSQIISLVTLGVFLLFLSLGFLIGLARGLKKASLRLAVFVVSTIIAFLITPMISRLALNLDLSFVGMNGSLSDFIQTEINNNPQVSDFVGSSLTMQNFVEQIPYLVLNLVTFFVLFLVISFVGFIAYQILKAIFLRNKKPKEWKDGNAYKVALEDKRPGKHRLLGGLLGGVQSLAFMAILLIPVSGFVTLAYDIAFQSENVAQASNYEYSPTAKILQENLPAEVLDGLKAYRTSTVGITSSIFGADTFMFDALTRVTISTQEGELQISYRSETQNLAEIYNNLEFMIELDFDTIVYKDLDYDKIEKAVDIIFDSKLLATLAPEVLNWVLLDINRPQADQILNLDLPADQLAILNKVTDEYENIFGTIYKGLKNDFDTVVQVAVGAGKSGLVDEAISQAIDLDKIKDILQANNKEVITKTFSNLFKAISLRVFAVEAINLGLEEASNTSVTFSPVSYEKVNWDGVISDVTTIANNLLDMLVNVSNQFSGGIQEVIDENPYELLNADTTLLTSKLGIIMTTLQNTNLLVDENGDKVVYNELMDYLNTTEFSDYIDFAQFKQTNAWTNEMANLNNIILSIKKSTILSDIINNIDDLGAIDFNSVLQKIIEIDPDNSQTYTYNILNSILSSNAFKKVINIGFDMLNELIEDNQEMLGSGTSLGKLQGDRLSTEQEKAYILSFFDNIVLYASELEWNGDQNQLISAIVESNLSTLGLALDAIENSAIFGSYTENGLDYDGVYASLITALNNNAELSNFAYFTIVLTEDFDGWNVEFARVKTILDNLKTIEINGKTLINAILDGDDLSSLVDNLEISDIDALVDPIIESQLLSKNVTMFVETINQMVADFTGEAIDSVTTADVIAQKEDVKAIVKQALGLTNVLTGTFDEDALKQNAEVFGEFLNLLKDNKLNNTSSVFGQTYDALVDYLVNEPTFGNTITDLFNEYQNQDEIDWQELFELFVQMGEQDFEQGFTPEFKTLFANVFSTMKQDVSYQEITVTVIEFMESFTNLDGISSFEDFVLAYTNALNGLAVEQDAFSLGNVEYANRVGVVLDFFNSFIPSNDFDILDFKKITNYSDEIASANAFESSMTNFEQIDFENDDIDDINQNIDDLLGSLANSQLLFDLIEDSSIDFDDLDSNAKIIVADRIDASYSGEMRDRLNAFFNI